MTAVGALRGGPRLRKPVDACARRSGVFLGTSVHFLNFTIPVNP